jgi:hypothetical protein
VLPWASGWYYVFCLSIAILIQQTERMCHMILLCMACLTVSYFSTVSQFWENVIDHKMCVLIFSTILSETFLILRRIQPDAILKLHPSSCEVPIINVTF